MTPPEAQELARLVLAMRQAQRDYFRKGGGLRLTAAKAAEQAVDHYLEMHFRPRSPTLFDDWSEPQTPPEEDEL